MKIEVSAKGLGVFHTVEVVNGEFKMHGQTYKIEDFKEAQDTAWLLHAHILKLIN